MNSGKQVAPVRVAVGVIYDHQGRVLVSQRSARQHLGGYWEFPGGKVEPGEKVRQGLARELQEELGIVISADAARPLCLVEHDYGDKRVLLDVWQVWHYEGTPRGLEGQPLRWVFTGELRTSDFPAANRNIIRSLRLPECIAIVNLNQQTQSLDAADIKEFVAATTAADQRMPFIRLRAAWPELKLEDLDRARRHAIGEDYLQAADSALQTLTEHGIAALLDIAPLLEHSPKDVVKNFSRRYTSFTGMHCHHRLLTGEAMGFQPAVTSWIDALRSNDALQLGASCHNAQELRDAARLGVDFAMVSPVLPTATHPDASPLGWQGLQTLISGSRVPIYALGGMRVSDLPMAQESGARGIAGVSLLQARPSNERAVSTQGMAAE